MILKLSSLNNAFPDFSYFDLIQRFAIFLKSILETVPRIVSRASNTSVTYTFTLFVLIDMPMILCSVAGVFLLHQTTNFAVDLFAIGSNIEPKLGVPLLLTVLFYNHICSSAEIYNDFHDMLVSIRCSPEIHLLWVVLLCFFEKSCDQYCYSFSFFLNAA